MKHVETSQCHNSVITKTQHDLLTSLCGVDLSVADVFSSIDVAGTVFLPSSLLDEVFICVYRGKWEEGASKSSFLPSTPPINISSLSSVMWCDSCGGEVCVIRGQVDVGGWGRAKDLIPVHA